MFLKLILVLSVKGTEFKLGQPHWYQGYLLIDRRFQKRAPGSGQNNRVWKSKKCERMRLGGPHLSELEGWPSLDWVRAACFSLHLEEMHRLELKVELAGMLIILNDQFPHGCQVCAQKATRIHF